MISYAAKSTFVTTNGASMNLAYMGSISPGDLLIIQVLSVQEGLAIGDIDTPSGFTFLNGGTGFRNSTPVNVGSYKCFYRIADGTESGNVSISRTGGNGGGAPPTPMSAQMYRFTGTRINLATSSVNILGDGNSTITWTSIGGPPGMTKIALVGARTSDPGNPSGYTAQASDSGGGATCYLECADLENTSGSGGATASGGNADGWATVLAAFFEAKGVNQILDH